MDHDQDAIGYTYSDLKIFLSRLEPAEFNEINNVIINVKLINKYN